MDPPSRSSGPSALSIQSRSHFVSRPVPSPVDVSSPSMTIAQEPWSQVAPGLQPSTSDSASPTNHSLPTNISKALASKTKKRKAEGNTSDRASEESGFNDQHIHPSRRAVLSNKPVSTSSASTTSSLGSSSSSKQMPKKLANLLQRWSEKDKEESDEDEHEQEHERRDHRHEQQGSGRQDLHSPSAPMTGANSHSLGGDWRDRRLRSK